MNDLEANKVSLDEAEDVRHMQLVRVRYGIPMECFYLSDEPVIVKLHYYDNRSWLHRRENCPHCEKSPWTKLESYSLIRYRGTTCILALPARATYALAGLIPQCEKGIQFRKMRLERKRSEKGPIVIHVDTLKRSEELGRYLTESNLQAMVSRILSD